MADIRYLRGPEMDAYVPSWADEVEKITNHEPHLLPHQAEILRAANATGRVIIAIDLEAHARIVGCIVLWPLYINIRDEAEWNELGTVFVIPEYRYSANRDLKIADTLYRRMLKAFPHEQILATTTNPSALKSGERAGLKHPGFRVLPDEVRDATCVCPKEKTGVDNPRDCPLRDTRCFVRVSPETWQRLGQPDLIPFSHVL